MRRKFWTAFTMLSLLLLASCDDDALSDNDKIRWLPVFMEIFGTMDLL